MIKLTLRSQTTSYSYVFDQKVVTIGSGEGPIQADLNLKDKDLQPIHVKVVQEGAKFIALNFANDPFVTLNNLPFGKKELRNKDLLHIGPHIILFEHDNHLNILENVTTLSEEKQYNSLNVTLEQLIEAQTQLQEGIQSVEARCHSNITDRETHAQESTHDQEKEKTDLNANTTQKLSETDKGTIETAPDTLSSTTPLSKPLNFEPERPLTSSENLSENKKNQEFTQNQAIPSKPPTPSPKKNAYDYEVGEFDDESENWNTDKEEKVVSEYAVESDKPSRIINWKMMGTIIVSLGFTFALILGGLYFNVKTKNENDELKASESVADVAMALKYAQIHHIKPHKKNWSDTEFIKKSLAQVIPHDYPSLAKIDQQGHLNHTSYSLRIYASSDFSQFLVIAQPAPSFWQWFMPKTAIVVDSKLMQLKKVADMKTLNRLLVNSNNLDNSNAIEVTNLVKRGELVPLNTLAKRRKGQDFSPPKALALLRPGAENYIYNAPRYYQLGETIMKRAIDLMEMPDSAYEMSRLKQDMILLSKLHDMVLYSSDGVQLTLDAQKAIATFVSNARFLTAYLKFDTKGVIINSHLIIDDGSSHLQAENTKIQKNKAEQIAAEIIPRSAVKAETTQTEMVEVHPLLTHLDTLCRNRENALLSLKNQVITLIDEDASHPIDGFETRLSDMIQDYLEVDVEEKKIMAKAIHRLAEENRLMPLDEFISYLNKAGLGEGCHEVLKNAVEKDDQKEKMQDLISKIKNAKSFIELEKVLSQATHWLVVKNFSDLFQLQMAQRLIKIEMISRINKLLLSAMPTPLEVSYDTQQLGALQHILQHTVSTSEERSYYLEEFERKMNEVGASESASVSEG